jgi:hypothetical protein
MSKSAPKFKSRSEGIYNSGLRSLGLRSSNQLYLTVLIVTSAFISFISISKLNATIVQTSKPENNCSFAKPYSKAPIPVILMSLGRSGSSVTWNTLSTMLGSTTTAYELTGGNKTKSANFFNSMEPDSVDWAVEKLCRIQRYHIKHTPNSVITGFQWKPYKVTLDHPLGKAALESIAKHTEPQIKVIFLVRNPLDRIISNLRHKGHIGSDEIPAHCAIDDEECVERHKAMSKNVTFQRKKQLIRDINHANYIDQLSKDRLSTYGVHHLSVSYEKLYNAGEDVREWKRIFDFLGRSPKNVANYTGELTRKHVEDAFAIAPTSVKSHKLIISNYDEVEEALVNAGYGHLLH